MTNGSCRMETHPIHQGHRENGCLPHNHRKAAIVTDSMSTLQRVKGGHLYADWIGCIGDSQLLSVTWLFFLVTSVSRAMRELAL